MSMVTATVLGYNDTKQGPTRHFRHCLKWTGRGCLDDAPGSPLRRGASDPVRDCLPIVDAAAETGEPLALQGYDPVAYFADDKASRGSEQYQVSWDGARYQFVTPEHQEAFRREPEKFTPQFASWCTMGLGAGKRVTADPEAWLIMDGKLYLFSSTGARDKFLQNPTDYLAKAERTLAAPR
ncbi:MAG: YHS domain-containing (seleno)protein [Rhodospirillales bacterium]